MDAAVVEAALHGRVDELVLLQARQAGELGSHDRRGEVVAAGDLVAYRATLSGTHEGELLGMPPTGRSFAVQHMHMLRMRDGRACEHWAVRDDLGMLQQLGIIPAPGGGDGP